MSQPNKKSWSFCEWLGMDPVTERSLMWIAREALKAPLPENWRICYTEDRDVYYFNMRTGESIWDHPMDAYYTALFKQERAKLEKKRKHMRLLPGGMDIKPIADYFSDACFDAQECNNDGSAPPPWSTIPESLTDAIDFKIYVEPVVLPTSGRTVSRRTIINNRWRDPFTRDYVENRRLVPNVDKRNEVDQWLNQMISAFFAVLPPTANGIQRLLCLLPFMLDKEEEVCVRAQKMLLQWVESNMEKFKQQQQQAPNEHHHPPAPGETRSSKQKGSATRKDAARATVSRKGVMPPPANSSAAPAPIPLPSILDQLTQLPDDASSIFLNSILTMSSSSSRELLLVVMQHAPSYLRSPVFRDFSSDVLNVLHLSTVDLSRMAACIVQHVTSSHDKDPQLESAGSLENISSAYSLTDTDHIISLKWLHLLFSHQIVPRTFKELDFVAVLHLVLGSLATKSITSVPSTVFAMMESAEGWPSKLSSCTDEHIRWLIQAAMGIDNHSSLISVLYDLVLHGNERSLDILRSNQALVFGWIVELSKEAHAANPSASLLASVMLFHEMISPDELAAYPRLALRVGYNLGPRLTRSQWKPKHFHDTVCLLIGLVESHPADAWEMVGNAGVLFFIRELNKKKTNTDEMRGKLESIEASERQLQQSCAVGNWALLVALQQEKIKKSSNEARQESASATPNSGPLLPQIKNPSAEIGSAPQDLVATLKKHKSDLHQQRARNIIAVWTILMNVRLKPKQRGDSKRPAGTRPPDATETDSRKVQKNSVGHESGPPSLLNTTASSATFSLPPI